MSEDDVWERGARAYCEAAGLDPDEMVVADYKGSWWPREVRRPRWTEIARCIKAELDHEAWMVKVKEAMAELEPAKDAMGLEPKPDGYWEKGGWLAPKPAPPE